MKKISHADKAVLLNAKLRMRIGVYLLIFSIILLVVKFLPRPLFREIPKSELTEYGASTNTADVYEYEPIRFDSVDIKDGIHLPTGMIADTGCAEVVQNCGACHSLELVKQNRATKEGWKKTITWMQETQKLWDLGMQEETILNYLAKNYGPENSGRRKNLENIEWYKL